MIITPDILPFNFTKSEVIDYITTFPNSENTNQDRNLIIPEWVQKVPVGVSIDFCVWTTLTLSVSSTDGTISIELVLNDGTYNLYRVTFTPSSVGLNTITLSDTEDEMTSNTFSVVSNFQDDVDEWVYIEFMHNRTAFDYYFDRYYKIWAQISNRSKEPTTDISQYKDDGDKNTTTYATFNKGLQLEFSPTEDWFAEMLVNVFACSDIKVNGIEYTPDGAASMSQLEEGVNMSKVECNLQKK